MTYSIPRIFLLVLIIFFSHPVRAAKTDIVYLNNGDRITGEAKSLTRGKLEFKTDHMGTLYIEWSEIRDLVSKTGQSVELTNGERFYGSLEKPASPEMLMVKTEQGPVGISLPDVVSMYPVEAGFWQRLDLTARLGFSWDKGSNVGKYNFGFDAIYRLPHSITRANFSSEITTQQTADSTTRASLSADHSIFLPNKKFHSYFGNLERNDELGIDLRALLGAGYGWVPVRSQKNWFSLAAGLDVNREVPVTGGSETNLEAVGMLVYEYFQYDSPERSFKVNFLVFPSLTDPGRWRASFSTDFRYEMVSDLFWNLSFYADFDSAPISAEAATSDYGVISSLGYKF